MISLFKNAFSPTKFAAITLDEILTTTDELKNIKIDAGKWIYKHKFIDAKWKEHLDPLHGKTVEQLLSFLRDEIQHHGKSELYRTAKQLLPIFNPRVTFKGEGRKLSDISKHNNLIEIDVDNQPYAMGTLIELPWVWAVKESASGVGFSVYAHILDNLAQEGHYNWAVQQLKEVGIDTDVFTEANRARALSWGPDDYINDDAAAISEMIESVKAASTGRSGIEEIHEPDLNSFIAAMQKQGLTEEMVRAAAMALPEDSYASSGTLKGSYSDNVDRLISKYYGKGIYASQLGDGIEEPQPKLKSTGSVKPPPVENEIQFGGFIHKLVAGKLPVIIQNAINLMVTDNQKDALLWGMLPACSQLMPNVKVLSFGKAYNVNIITYLVARSGSGKDAAGLTLTMLRAVIEDYDARAAANKAEIIAAKMSKEPAVAMKDFDLILNSHTTVAMFLQSLHDMDGAGLMFETEASIIGKKNKGDNSYEELFLKTLDNGKYSKKTLDSFINGRPLPKIERVKFSAFLSSTLASVTGVIENVTSGMLSRMMFHSIPSVWDWVDGDDMPNYEIELSPITAMIADQWARVYRHWADGKGAVEVIIPDKLKASHREFFIALKGEMVNEVHQDLDGVVNRWGLMAKKMAAIFSVMKVVEAKDIDQFGGDIIMDKDSLDAALAIIESIVPTTITIFDYIRGSKKGKSASNGKTDDADAMSVEDRRKHYDKHKHEFETDKDYHNKYGDLIGIKYSTWRSWKRR